MSKIFLGCMGQYLRGSGAGKIWTESLVFGINVVESVLNGRCYVRSPKGMLLLGENMLQWCEFFKIYGTQQYADELEILRRQLQAETQKFLAYFMHRYRGHLIVLDYQGDWNLYNWNSARHQRTSADLQALLFHSRHFLNRVHRKICPANQNSRLAVNFAELLHIHL